MAIIFPRPTGRTIPRGRLRIDWTHPLTNGLLCCYVPGVMGGIDIADNGGPTDCSIVTGQAASNVVTLEGPAFQTPATTTGSTISSMGGLISGALPTTSPLTNWSTGEMSFFWRGSNTPGVTMIASAYLIMITWQYPAGNPYEMAGISPSASNQLWSVWNDGNVTEKTGASKSASTPTDGTPWSALSTFKVGGNVVSYYNGAQYDSTAIGGTPKADGTATIQMMGRGHTSYYNSLGGRQNIGCIWNRVLSADEAAYLDKFPYCFLIGDEGEWPALYLNNTASLSLATTEAIDVAAITTTLSSSLSLATTEATDVAAITTTLSSSLSLSTTEGIDVAAFTLADSSSLSLSTTEGIDTAAITLADTSSLSLATTEGIDVAALNVMIPASLSLAVTEAHDTCSVNITLPSSGNPAFFFAFP